MYIHSNRIYTPAGCIEGILHIQNGKIKEILSKNANVTCDLDVQDKMILPGIIDTHNHGTMGYGLMGECQDTERTVRGYLKGLASQGVTSCLPTAELPYFKAIAKIAKEEVDGAQPIGIHSEGPYLNRVGEKGIDTGHPDIDLAYIQKMIDESEGMLKLVALAPELPLAKEAIEYLTSRHVRCAFAHSNCNYEEAMRSFSWGITVTTHTANVMSGIHHRRMGGLGACMLSDEVFNELICDGLHVSNEMIRLMLRMKNDAYHQFMMVSHNVPMSGAPIGSYRMAMGNGDELIVTIDEKGYCLSDTGRLCGSTLPVLSGVKNLVQNIGLPLEKVLLMCSKNPAMVYGANDKGSIEEGKDADLIVVDDQFRLFYTYSQGRCVYDSQSDKNIFNTDFLKEHAV